jgi:uncharacterized protein YwqG
MSFLKVLFIVIAIIAAVIIFKKLDQKEFVPENVEYKKYFENIKNPTIHNVLAVYRELGYTTIADDLEKKALPCANLISDPAGTRPLSSRIGGRPALVNPELWPKYKGKSLAFIAQLNLEDLPPEMQSDVLPSKGLLYFFYVADQSTWGYDPAHKGSWAVLYTENVPADTPLTEFPTDLPEHGRFREKPVRLEKSISIPDPNSILPGKNLGEKQEDEIADVYGQFTEYGGSIHQLLGYPAQIQGDMQLECQLVSNGLYCGDETGYNDPRAGELKKGASQWRLLLQVDTDNDTDMMWGDSGRIYFWIKDSDLKNMSFVKAWMVLQCY